MKKKTQERLDKIKDAIAWKGLKSIEFRILKWLFRALGVVAFAIYLIFAVNSAWFWAELKWMRFQDASHLDVLLEEAVASDDFSRVDKWLKYRPQSEAQDIVHRLTPHSSRLPTFIFFEFSVEATKIGDEAQADLWHMIALYRLRFDLLRCGVSDAVQMGAEMMDIFFNMRREFVRNIPDEKRRALSMEVLAFDEKYPAANNPAPVCTMIAALAGEGYSPMPREDWDSFRLGLQEATRLTANDTFRKMLSSGGIEKKK